MKWHTRIYYEKIFFPIILDLKKRKCWHSKLLSLYGPMWSHIHNNSFFFLFQSNILKVFVLKWWNIVHLLATFHIHLICYTSLVMTSDSGWLFCFLVLFFFKRTKKNSQQSQTWLVSEMPINPRIEVWLRKG